MSIRQTVTFTEPQMKWLHKRAKKLGITVSDAIRRLIDESRSRPDAITGISVTASGINPYPPGDKITITDGRNTGAIAKVRRV